MDSCAITTFPSHALIAWLEQLLRGRLSSQISLSYDFESNHWKLTCTSSELSIILPQISSLYTLGISLALPCSSWDVRSEGFNSIEPLLPAPGCETVQHPLITSTESGFYLNYDIFGFTYWMLARCEEIDPPGDFLDTHQRFLSTASHAFRHGYLERPLVDEWFCILRQVVERLWPQLLLVRSQFKVVVSHDVDRPSAYAFGSKRLFLKEIAGDILKRNSLELAFNRSLVRLKTTQHLQPLDPFNTFDWLMDASENAGIRSSFYFLCGRTNPCFDAQYQPGHPVIRHLMRCINRRGHEIGLHPSYETSTHSELVAHEGQRLLQICKEEGIQQNEWGGRMHYLRWRWPSTAYAWERSGFDYDSTLGYPDRPGFRCGTCHPYFMFDPVTQRQLNLVQRPLIVMDCSVISSQYLGLGYTDKSLSLFVKLKNNCKFVGGNYTLLWHNSHFMTKEDHRFYLHLLSSGS